MTIFVLPAGGFMVYGFMMVIFNAVVKSVENAIARKKAEKAEKAGRQGEQETDDIIGVQDTETETSELLNGGEQYPETSSAEGGNA